MFMRSLFILGSASLVVGCAAGSPDAPDAEAQTATTAAAIVVVERTVGPGDATRGDAIVARFVRARQGLLDDHALRTAGVQDAPAAGTCVTSLEAPAAAARAIDLLDVGSVTFEASEGKNTILLPRAMPDPAGVVSGYFYSARSAEAFAPGSRVSLRASGGQDLPDGFVVNVAAPRDVDDVRIAPSAAGLDVFWDAEGSDPRDVVYVDVLAPNVVARCAASDAGHLTVPAGAVANVDDGTLAVHRLHREPFRARGIDPGEIRFDLARAVAFHR